MELRAATVVLTPEAPLGMRRQEAARAAMIRAEQRARAVDAHATERLFVTRARAAVTSATVTLSVHRARVTPPTPAMAMVSEAAVTATLSA